MEFLEFLEIPEIIYLFFPNPGSSLTETDENKEILAFLLIVDSALFLTVAPIIVFGPIERKHSWKMNLSSLKLLKHSWN